MSTRSRDRIRSGLGWREARVVREAWVLVGKRKGRPRGGVRERGSGDEKQGSKGEYISKRIVLVEMEETVDWLRAYCS